MATVILNRQALSLELGQAGGGGQGLFFFAEGEAHLGDTVAGIVIEAGAGHDGHADFLD